jgi:hypothetical protein
MANQNFSGSVTILKPGGKAKITLDDDGQIVVHDKDGEEMLRFKAEFANLRIGGPGDPGSIQILGSKAEEVIRLDGSTGDITLKGADCAEALVARNPLALDPGSVAVVGPDGGLEPCCNAYDTRVAGVIAGARDLRPGILLGQNTAIGSSVPLSLTGRVWCKVDADFGPIHPGDLLTTSTTLGHAMRVNDRSRAAGSIVGKALGALESGHDMVPILVGLQ